MVQHQTNVTIDWIEANIRKMIDPLSQPTFCALQQHAFIRVSGADAGSFLQGQLSNDVLRVTAQQSQLTSLNTPQGRTLALMRLFEFDGALLLSLPMALQAPVVERLRKYILRSRVEIEPCDDRVVRYGLAGESADTVLSAAGVAPPAAVDQAHAQSGLAIIRVPADGGSRFELYGYKDKMTELRGPLMARCNQAGPDAWRLLDTLAGIPWLGPETSGEFLPQMLNLDELGAINFQKGCYAGQEIIARTHYRGQVKRRLKLIFRGEPASAGATITVSENASAIVIQSAPHPKGGYVVLAVAPVDSTPQDAR